MMNPKDRELFMRILVGVIMWNLALLSMIWTVCSSCTIKTKKLEHVLQPQTKERRRTSINLPRPGSNFLKFTAGGSPISNLLKMGLAVLWGHGGYCACTRAADAHDAHLFWVVSRVLGKDLGG